MMQALKRCMGPEGGAVWPFEQGRAGFKYALRDFGSLLGLADLAFRLLPLGMKLKVALDAMADTFNNFSDQRVHVEEGRRYLLCHRSLSGVLAAIVL